MVKPGVPVMTARGQAGKLGGIIVDPTSLRVTGIILYQGWWTDSRVVSMQHSRAVWDPSPAELHSL